MKSISHYKIIYFQLKRFLLQRIDRFFNSNLSKPSQVFFGFSGKCNLKCKHCIFWKQENSAHINGDELQKIISDLYSVLGPVKISLAGDGEPFMEPCLLDACEYAVSLKIPIILNTNGTLINDAIAQRIVKMGIFGITFSLDGLKSHNHIRGDGIFQKASNSIQAIMKWKKNYNSNIRVMINTVIMSTNLDELVPLANWCKSIGSTIKFIQFRKANENENEYLWPTDINKVRQVLTSLKQCSITNKNILNTPIELDLIEKYYNKEMITYNQQKCLSMYDRIAIRSNKDVFICGKLIGNLSEQSIRAILTSPRAKKIRNDLRECKKNCFHNCATQGNLKRKTKTLYKYLFFEN